MPQTKLIYYQETEGNSPVVTWLRELRSENQKAYAKCEVRIKRLSEAGHELRRPAADFLRDGIYELRSHFGTVNYRVLYFFHGRNVAILAHGITKENEIPDVEINRAIARKEAFAQDPTGHTYKEEL
jgi:putative component of toxin-antitoxin plasmid stabilization module